MKTHFTAKALIVCFIFLLSANEMQAQLGQWTWVGGSDTTGVKGVYGNQGVPSYTNNPGARNGSVSWTDSSGNLWLFGGFAYKAFTFNYFNDLWKYNPSTNEWTWMKGGKDSDTTTVFGTMGVASTFSQPRARTNAVSWTDKDGNLWLFGGRIFGFSGIRKYLNDLWKYDISANQWTWMNGDSIANSPGTYGVKGTPSVSNSPGSRYLCTNWTDTAGHLWLFGGDGYVVSGNQNYYNDLWEYNPANNSWTWINGSNGFNAPSSYGLQNIPSYNNNPGARAYGFNWRDLQNNFWLFGGISTIGLGYYNNDLWKYIPSSNQWVWIKGDTVQNASGSYGTIGVSSPTNSPSARTGNSLQWIDKYGNLWFFGGFANINGAKSYNDMWSFNPLTSEWIWMKGSSSINIGGIYGTKGVSSSVTYLGARASSTSWIDLSGDWWSFGGNGYDSRGIQDVLNDLWKFTPDSLSLPVHLLTFTAQLQDKQTHLNWTVENEQNFDRYQIERSTPNNSVGTGNSKDFENIGSVKASHSRQYTFTDNNPTIQQTTPNTKPQTIFYRLKLIDRDGQFSYSKIVSVKLPSDNKFTISPNPAKDNILLQFSKTLTGKSTIEITDASGKAMLQKTVEANGSSLSVSTIAFPSGTYTVRFVNNGEEYLQKVVVVK